MVVTSKFIAHLIFDMQTYAPEVSEHGKPLYGTLIRNSSGIILGDINSISDALTVTAIEKFITANQSKRQENSMYHGSIWRLRGNTLWRFWENVKEKFLQHYPRKINIHMIVSYYVYN